MIWYNFIKWTRYCRYPILRKQYESPSSMHYKYISCVLNEHCSSCKDQKVTHFDFEKTPKNLAKIKTSNKLWLWSTNKSCKDKKSNKLWLWKNTNKSSEDKKVTKMKHQKIWRRSNSNKLWNTKQTTKHQTPNRLWSTKKQHLGLLPTLKWVSWTILSTVKIEHLSATPNLSARTIRMLARQMSECVFIIPPSPGVGLCTVSPSLFVVVSVPG